VAERNDVASALVQESLNQDQIALVLRRAAELDREMGFSCQDGLDPATIEQAALEAGLSKPAVRRALAEYHAGLLQQPDRRPQRRLLGSPTLSVCRTVPGQPQAVQRQLHQFLRDELFELRRDMGTRTTWVRRRGLEATARRAIDRAVQRRLILREVNNIDVSIVDHLSDGDEWALVRMDVDVLAARHAQGTVAGSAAVVGGGLTVMTTGYATEHPAFLAAALAGLGLVGAGQWVGSKLYGRRVAEIESGLDGVLDRLERGTTNARR
jgi:hypothetical protein